MACSHELYCYVNAQIVLCHVTYIHSNEPAPDYDSGVFTQSVDINT